ncbi:MAG: DUF4350 domain-containing protein [Acidobacteria bacterium]|nr:DUF4350 domain-containing protein [Acidobacteriota bacterium]
MVRYLWITLIGSLIIALLIGLSAAGTIELDRPEESEKAPIRSSFSTGPTGTRAFYQLLEESGKPVARFLDSYLTLDEKAGKSLLVIVGPFKSSRELPDDEAQSLQQWVAQGGNVLIVSRNPYAQFRDPYIHSGLPGDNPQWNAPPENLVNPRSDEFIVQPTELTKDLKGLALSTLVTRMKFYPPAPEPTPVPTPIGPPAPEEKTEDDSEDDSADTLESPVVHLGDAEGAILADFEYGEGRLVFLSDPFVIANNGIARGANLRLALNLINALSEDKDTILFDEYHHGYQSQSNPLVNYFRGTPMVWLLIQGALLCILAVYTYGRRFARPLPLPQIDRNSPLEFVGSMANLLQVARARDLALENIYPRFRSQLCRRLGISARANTQEIIAGLRYHHLPISEIDFRQALSDGEMVMKGEQIDDSHLVTIVRRMRRITAVLNRGSLKRGSGQ